MRREKGDQSSVNPGLEVTGRFPTGQTLPPFVVMEFRLRQIGVPGNFSRLTVPIGFAALLQPRVLFRDDAIASGERGRSLAGSEQRRHQEFIKSLVSQRVAKVLGLSKSPFGEPRVDNAQTVSDPFGLGMANERKFHTRQGSGR